MLAAFNYANPAVMRIKTLPGGVIPYIVVKGDAGTLVISTSNALITLPSCSDVGIGFTFWHTNTGLNAVTVQTGSLLDTFTDGTLSVSVNQRRSMQFIVVDAGSATGKWQLLNSNFMGGGASSVSVGYSASASASYAVAIGTSVGATSAYAVAIGYGSSSAGSMAVSIGTQTYVGGNYGTAIGSNSVGSASQSNGPGATALGGSYASSSDSFAAAVGNNTNSYGATNQGAVTIGYLNKATGSTSIAVGGTSNVSSGYCSAVVGGLGNIADGYAGTVVGGSNGTTRGVTGAQAWGSNGSASGRTQTGQYILRVDTVSNTTPTRATADGSSANIINGPIMPNNSTYYCRVRVIARDLSTGNSSSWNGTILITRGANAASTTSVAPSGPTQDFTTGSMVGCTATLGADTTNGGLSLTVVGLATTTIRWVAHVEALEVTN